MESCSNVRRTTLDVVQMRIHCPWRVIQMCDTRLWMLFKCKCSFMESNSNMRRLTLDVVQMQIHSHGKLFKCAMLLLFSREIVQTCDKRLWMLFKRKYTLMEVFKYATNDSSCCSNENQLSWTYSNTRQTTLDVVQMKINSHGKSLKCARRYWVAMTITNLHNSFRVA